MGGKGVDGRLDGLVQQNWLNFDFLGLYSWWPRTALQGRFAERRFRGAEDYAADSGKEEKEQVYIGIERICDEGV